MELDDEVGLRRRRFVGEGRDGLGHGPLDEVRGGALDGRGERLALRARPLLPVRVADPRQRAPLAEERLDEAVARRVRGDRRPVALEAREEAPHGPDGARGRVHVRAERARDGPRRLAVEHAVDDLLRRGAVRRRRRAGGAERARDVDEGVVRVVREAAAERAVAREPARHSHLRPDFNVRDDFDALSSAVLRALDESHRFVEKSAESNLIELEHSRARSGRPEPAVDFRAAGSCAATRSSFCARSAERSTWPRRATTSARGSMVTAPSQGDARSSRDSRASGAARRGTPGHAGGASRQ